jgi:hypothetical protein
MRNFLARVICSEISELTTGRKAWRDVEVLVAAGLRGWKGAKGTVTVRGLGRCPNVDGRKRHIVVDSMGLLLAILVTAASVDDAKAATELFARLDGQPIGKVVPAL